MLLLGFGSLDGAPAKGARHHPAGAAGIYPCVSAVQRLICGRGANAQFPGKLAARLSIALFEFPAIHLSHVAPLLNWPTLMEIKQVLC
jgi:hypothetical protein